MSVALVGGRAQLTIFNATAEELARYFASLDRSIHFDKTVCDGDPVRITSPGAFEGIPPGAPVLEKKAAKEAIDAWMAKPASERLAALKSALKVVT